jgi:hypothetical protein
MHSRHFICQCFESEFARGDERWLTLYLFTRVILVTVYIIVYMFWSVIKRITGSVYERLIKTQLKSIDFVLFLAHLTQRITRNIVNTLRPSLSSAFFNSSWQPLNRSSKSWQWCNSILFGVSNLSARAPLVSLYETKRASGAVNFRLELCCNFFDSRCHTGIRMVLFWYRLVNKHVFHGLL